MLVIKATFPDGSAENFGRPEDLCRYMKEEGYTEAQINAKYVFDTFADMHMTLDDISRWIEMKAEE